MPTTPLKYYQIKINSRIDFTSPEIRELRERKPSSIEYSDSIREISITSVNSRNILEFFAKYDNGFFIPEKCDAYEPIREKFDPTNLAAPIRWLSQPGCAVYFKKIKPFKYEGVIENNCLALVWDENGIPLSINKDTYYKRDPYFLSEIKLFIDYRITKIKSMEYLIEFFNELLILINGEYGFIKDAEDNIVKEKGNLPMLS